MRFNIPITDPRFLDATEEQIVEDMLVVRYWDAEQRRASDPTRRLGEEMDRNADDFVDVDRGLLDALSPDGEYGQRLARMHAPKPETKIASVRFAGRVVTRG